MKFRLTANSFYLFLAISGAALVPVMAYPQQAPDNGDGPSIGAYTNGDPSTKAQNDADYRKSRLHAHHKEEASGGPSGGGDSSPNATGPSAAQSAFTVDVQAGTNGATSGQVVSTNVSLSYKGNGEGASATVAGGAGTAGVVMGKFQVDGLRTNDPDPKKGFGGAGFVDGSGQVGNNGTGTITAVGGGELNGIVNLSDTVSCIIAGGIGFGGTYSNEFNNDMGQTTTTAYGPAAYLGAGCSGSKWDLALHNNVIVNAAPFSDPTNLTHATSEHKLQANYWLSDSIALTAAAKVDVDYRDGGPKSEYQLTGGMTFVLGGKGKPTASSQSNAQ